MSFEGLENIGLFSANGVCFLMLKAFARYCFCSYLCAVN